MEFFQIYLLNLAILVILMTLLWLVSVLLKNVSIVDLFWGFGFVLSAGVYAFYSVDIGTRGFLVLVLVTIWGIRLSGYLTWRNSGKGEDFRYREFRRQYGEKRYWWISYFQTFLLQGVLMWLISAPLLGAIKGHGGDEISMIDFIGLALWIIGFVFETGGDWQLAKFKSNPANRGSVLNSGFWRYTRHPNYFGDAAVWWGFGLFSISSGNYLPALGSLLMTALIIKVSGVYLLEKTLKTDKPGYASYIRQTSAFIPWFPKKLRS